MKQHLLKQEVFLLAITLLIFQTVPCQAMIMEKPSKEISSMGELLTWYNRLSDTTPQESVVTAPAVCTGEVVLDETSCRVDIIFINGLHIPSGTKLTIDNSNLVLMGPPPTIVVEQGGTLQINRINPLMGEAMPRGGIVVENGGTLLIRNGVTLPEGVVENQNPPPNKLPPIVKPELPELPELPKLPELPEPEPPELPKLPEPEPPDNEQNELDKPSDNTEEASPAEKLPLLGEVLKVTEKGMLYARLTVPFVDPLTTELITIERSLDSQTWNTEYVFRWNEDGQDFCTDNGLCSHNRRDKSKTDFQYLAMLSGTSFYLRIILTGVDGTKAVSNTIQMTELPVGQYPGSEDYEDSGGNRGGGGQGTSDRETQKEADSSEGGGSLPTTSKKKSEAFMETTTPTKSNLLSLSQTGTEAFASMATELALPLSQTGTEAFASSATELALPLPQTGAEATASSATELPLPSNTNTVIKSTEQSPSQRETGTSPSQVTEKKPRTSMEEQAKAMDKEAVSVSEKVVSIVEQSYAEEEKSTSDRGGLAVVATLALCGIIWAVTGIKSFKRKKS